MSLSHCYYGILQQVSLSSLPSTQTPVLGLSGYDSQEAYGGLQVGSCLYFTVSQDHFREGLRFREGGSNSRSRSWEVSRVKKETGIRDLNTLRPVNLSTLY